MPSDLRLNGLTWRPVGRRDPVLSDICLDIPAGQRVLLAGPSGSGKSTLLRAVAGVLETNESGEYAGSVTIGGRSPRAAAGGFGLLVQDPSDALVAHRVGRDVAFGLENLAVPRSEIWPRVRAALSSVSFPYGTDHLVSALSAGEMQRLALAGVVVMRPGLLLLDEPTAMLGAAVASSVRAAIVTTAMGSGATVVVVEHRLAPWVAQVDRLVVLSASGTVAGDGPCSTLLSQHAEHLAAQGVWVPGVPGPAPVTVPPELVEPWGGPALAAGDPALSARAVGVRRGERWTLESVEGDVVAGSALAVLGESGAGKSTLVSILAGLLRPSSGSVQVSPALARGVSRPPHRWRSRELAARVGWVPQHAEHAIVRHTVRDEVCATGLALERPPRRVEARALGLLEALGMSGLAGANPYQLSGGEQRRLTLATALAHGPDVLMLDEPTVGQDRLTWASVAGAIRSARRAGVAVAMATHDPDAVAAVADASLTLSAGRVTHSSSRLGAQPA